MLKHIKPKDVIEFFLIALGFMALMVVASILESAPLGIALWLAVALSVILWIAWWVVVVIQRNKETQKPKLKIMSNGEWVDVDSPNGAAALASAYSTPRRPIQLFDQDNKEQA